MSGFVNKVKEVLHKDTHTLTRDTNVNSATSASTNHGPHDSNAANKADPRIDSDRDGRAAHGHNTTTGGIGSTTHGTTGHSSNPLSSNTHGTTTTGGIGSTHNTTGHSSNPLSSNTHHSTTTGGTTGGFGSNTHTHGSTNAGPHDSNAANKLDPRIDSDRDGSHTAGNTHNTHTHGTTGHSSNPLSGNTHQGHSATYGSTNNGPHDSNLANRADPRVDSDLSSTGNRHGANTGGVFGASGSHATSGSGTAQNTSGPHNSDLLNKLDPRVDSDKDGSKTVGGNKTHA